MVAYDTVSEDTRQRAERYYKQDLECFGYSMHDIEDLEWHKRERQKEERLHEAGTAGPSGTTGKERSAEGSNSREQRPVGKQRRYRPKTRKPAPDYIQI